MPRITIEDQDSEKKAKDIKNLPDISTVSSFATESREAINNQLQTTNENQNSRTAQQKIYDLTSGRVINEKEIWEKVAEEASLKTNKQNESDKTADEKRAEPINRKAWSTERNDNYFKNRIAKQIQSIDENMLPIEEKEACLKRIDGKDGLYQLLKKNAWFNVQKLIELNEYLETNKKEIYEDLGKIEDEIVKLFFEDAIPEKIMDIPMPVHFKADTVHLKADKNLDVRTMEEYIAEMIAEKVATVFYKDGVIKHFLKLKKLELNLSDPAVQVPKKLKEEIIENPEQTGFYLKENYAVVLLEIREQIKSSAKFKELLDRAKLWDKRLFTYMKMDKEIDFKIAELIGSNVLGFLEEDKK